MDLTLIYLIIFFLSFTLFTFYSKKAGEFSFFSPFFLFPLIYFIYSFAGLLYFYENQEDIFGNSFGFNIGLEYFITCILGLLGFYIGFFWVIKSKVIVKVIPSVNPVTFKYIIFFYILISVLVNPTGIFSQFDLSDIKSYGEVAFDSRLEYRNNKEFALVEIFFQTTPIFLLIYSCLEQFKKSKSLLKIIYIIPCALLIVHSFLSGTRAVFVSYFLFIFFYLYFTTNIFKSINFIKAVFLIVGFFWVYVIINIIPIVRSASDFSQMITLFESFYNQYGFSFLKLQNSSELQTSINLQKLQHEIINNGFEFTYGVNLLNDFLVFIPRIFYDNRPLPTSELFASVFYKDVYSQGGGMGMFVLIDGYWSFGNLGVLITSIFFSAFIAVLYRSILVKINSNPTSIFIFVTYFQAFIVSAVRGGMILSLRSFFLGIFIFYFLAIMSKNLVFTKVN
ncbi:O-antigen polymerase [Sandaracinomonas limnophila]|uniref:O-antigen polymerase n=1 Tax=Sandaracinomonas limnophila TaxID=1862386 RepID=UPI0013E31A9C|nr:O-antigen polymerase [Sandaracinomonas limnophila]